MQPSGYGNLPDGRLDATFAALADPTRRAILARLASGEASVRELTEPFAMSQAAVSKHLKVLERAGLIVRSQRAQYRPCALDPTALQAVSTWADHHRHIWEQRFDRMDDRLRQLEREERDDG